MKEEEKEKRKKKEPSQRRPVKEEEKKKKKNGRKKEKWRRKKKWSKVATDPDSRFLYVCLITKILLKTELWKLKTSLKNQRIE